MVKLSLNVNLLYSPSKPIQSIFKDFVYVAFKLNQVISLSA